MKLHLPLRSLVEAIGRCLCRNCAVLLLLLYSVLQGATPSLADGLYQWTWVNGPKTLSDVGSYGQLGIEAQSNLPSARKFGATWTGNDGRLWLFGGSTPQTNNPNYADLWSFDPASGNWVWKKGPSTPNPTGVYGVQGTPAAANNPGARFSAASRAVQDSLLWLFGGYGRDSVGTSGALNDLWRFDPATNEWTWIKGSNLVNRNGVYGTQGVSAPANAPGGRNGASMWWDARGFLWLFGGSGYAASGSDNYLNDLWRFDVTTGQWAWIKGSNTTGRNGTYGTKGVPGAANTPGARSHAAVWTDEQGRLWLFGGFGYNYVGQQGMLNDVWMFDPITEQWTWVNGTNQVNQFGIYGTQNVPAASNMPGSRNASATWRDAQGRFWIYGGLGYGVSGVGSSALADLWYYDPKANLWTWVRDGNGGIQSAYYGTQGEATDRTRPGSKWQTHAWTDARGRLWVFGGQSYSESFGSGTQNDLWRFDPQAVPAVTTLAAAEVSDVSARLPALINPNGQATTVRFRYGTSANLSGATEIVVAYPSVDLTTGSAAALAASLSPSTRYYFQATATNASGTGLGSILSFNTAATPAVKPTVTTLPGSAIGKRSAALNGSVNANGVSTNVGFEWGLTGALENFTGYIYTVGGTTSEIRTFALGGLSPDTTYYFRVRAENAGSFPQRGEILSFTTATAIKTDAASQVSFTAASLNGRGNPEGGSTVGWFEYGATPELGQSTAKQAIGSGEQLVPFASRISDLTPDQGYFYRAVIENDLGIERGPTIGFRTPAAEQPVARTVRTFDVAARSATLVGSVTSNGEQSVGNFDLGVTTSYGTSTVGKILGPEDVGSEYSVVVEGLLPHTEYHFRAVATSPAGKGVGEDLSFTTANTNPVAQPKPLHASPLGAGMVVYSAAVDTSDEDGDARQLEVVSYSGIGSAVSNGSEVSYVNGGFVGSETITVRVSDGFGGSAQTAVTLRNEAPVARVDSFRVGTGETVLSVLANDGDSDGDALEITSASASSGGSVSIDGQTLKYLPGGGFSGVEVLSYSISDHRGGTASAQVTVVANYSVVRTAAEKKGLVPGQEKTVWKRFGTPSLFAGGTRAGWLATVKAGRNSYQGIFSGEIGAPVLRVRAGDAAPTSSAEAESEGKFTKFAEPVFAGDRFGFLGTVSGKKITAGNDTGIWVGEGSTLRAVAREGSSAPGTNGARYRSFTSLAMPGAEAAFFVAKLESVGTAKVTDANDVGLWIWSPSGTRLALREGQTVDLGSGTLRVRKFEVLPLVSSSAGHGRYDATELSVDARITFADDSVALASIGMDGEITLVARTGDADAGGRIPEEFGVPSSPGGGARPVAIVGFRAGKGGITRQGAQTVYDFESEQVVAQEGAAAPGANGGKFLSFLDVVAGRGTEGQRVTALLGSLSGVTQAGDIGIWASREGATEPLELVAREGTEPPGAPGAVFKSFQSLSVQEGRGVLFKAKLASGTSPVKRSNDEGLWATDTTGELRLLLRKGDVIGGKILQAFTILHPVARTQGQRRAWNSGDAAATLIYLASFADGSNAVLTTSVP